MQSIPYHAEVEYRTEGKVCTPPTPSNKSEGEGAKKHRELHSLATANLRSNTNASCSGDQSSPLQEWEATPNLDGGCSEGDNQTIWIHECHKGQPLESDLKEGGQMRRRR